MTFFVFFYLRLPAAESFWSEIYKYHPESEKVNTMPDKIFQPLLTYQFHI
jgi:hypothetical protein